MTPEQGVMILCICIGLDAQAVTGEWPLQHCRWCRGYSTGYSDAQEFHHETECIVPLVYLLRETVRKEIEK